MTDPIIPDQPDPRNKVITLLRIFLWLMPAIFIPAAFIIALFINNINPITNEEIILVSMTILLIVATAFVGYFDQRLSLMQKKIPPPHDNKEILRWTVIFVLAQIMIAPTVCFAGLYGICMVTRAF